MRRARSAEQSHELSPSPLPPLSEYSHYVVLYYRIGHAVRKRTARTTNQEFFLSGKLPLGRCNAVVCTTGCAAASVAEFKIPLHSSVNSSLHSWKPDHHWIETAPSGTMSAAELAARLATNLAAHILQLAVRTAGCTAGFTAGFHSSSENRFAAQPDSRQAVRPAVQLPKVEAAKAAVLPIHRYSISRLITNVQRQMLTSFRRVYCP